MVRKQIYLHQRQQRLLDQLARARGVSQAEIIRRAIEREAAGAAPQPTPPDRAAWDELLASVAARKLLGSAGAAYRWHREDAYQERERRYDQARLVDPG
jgi:hypothetical protein